MKSEPYAARIKLIEVVKRRISSEWYAEAHPDDPHGDDEANYCDDMIDQAARELAESLAE